MTKTIRLEITNHKTGKIARTVDTSQMSDRSIERTMMGMLINMDTENWYINEIEEVTK